jgi:hypothetical protein
MLLIMGGDTTRSMYSGFPEINKLCNVASRWKYIKTNILTMHGPLNVKKNLNPNLQIHYVITSCVKTLIQSLIKSKW